MAKSLVGRLGVGWMRCLAVTFTGMMFFAGVSGSAQTPQPRPPAFRAGIDVVSVTAVVRDRRGRVVRDLSRDDFVVFDSGRRRRIVEFQAEVTAPVSLALLFDVSGSMGVTSRTANARHAADHVLSWLEVGRDEASLFTFDTSLREIQPFTKDGLRLQQALDTLQPFGATSLYDAIADTAKRVSERAGMRRALVVLTDGIDTSSRLTPEQVSGVASAIDVPVYVLVVVSPVDHPGRETGLPGTRMEQAAGELSDLARWTGGDLFVMSAPAHASAASRQLLAELRHQYLIAFESSGTPGWHPLEIRTTNPDLVVRARSGYIAGD